MVICFFYKNTDKKSSLWVLTKKKSSLWVKYIDKMSNIFYNIIWKFSFLYIMLMIKLYL